jgi:hypothetical protein
VNNKLFFLLIAAILLPVFGWMFYDLRTSGGPTGAGAASRDLLGSGDSTAAVQYFFHFPDPVYHHDLNTQQIEALAQGGGENYHVYGLTQADYQLNTHFQVNGSKKWFKDQYTMWVDNLRVEFSYTTVNVYVTSNYKDDSCEYRQTLAHENQHVEINRQVYGKYEKVFQDTLAGSRDLPLYDRPITVGSWDEGKERIGRMISTVTDPVFDRFKEELGQAQSVIDTPQEYDLLRQSCQNW